MIHAKQQRIRRGRYMRARTLVRRLIRYWHVEARPACAAANKQ
jgi:hypothetical protein